MVIVNKDDLLPNMLFVFHHEIYINEIQLKIEH